MPILTSIAASSAKAYGFTSGGQFLPFPVKKHLQLLELILGLLQQG